MLDDARWFEPTTVLEAVELLRVNGEGAYLIAGGTELLVKLSQDILTPGCLIDISRLPSLKGIEEQEEWVRLGAAVTFSELRRSPLIQAEFSVLAEAAAKIGGIQIQNAATLGGNLCNAEPCADAAAACIALHAQVRIHGLAGSRQLAVTDLFLSPGKTSLSRTDILTEVLLPRHSLRTGSTYEKLSLRKAMDQSLVAVGVLLELEEGDVCRQAGIGLATAAPVPMRACEAEGVLVGRELTPERISAAAAAAAGEARPRDSRKATALYRRAAIRELTEKALRRAWLRARAGEPVLQ